AGRTVLSGRRCLPTRTTATRSGRAAIERRPGGDPLSGPSLGKIAHPWRNTARLAPPRSALRHAKRSVSQPSRWQTSCFSLWTTKEKRAPRLATAPRPVRDSNLRTRLKETRDEREFSHD